MKRFLAIFGKNILRETCISISNKLNNTNKKVEKQEAIPEREDIAEIYKEIAITTNHNDHYDRRLREADEQILYLEHNVNNEVSAIDKQLQLIEGRTHGYRLGQKPVALLGE